METLPRYQDNHSTQSLLPSPTSHSSSSSSSNSSSNSSSTTSTPTNNGALNNNINHPPPLPSPKPISRSESTNPYPTTFVQADSSSFKQVVQMLTGSPKPTTTTPTTPQPDPSPKTHNIPPIKSVPKKNQSSGFKLYERRNSLKNLKINPLNPIFAQPSSGFSPRKPEILSPSILDFPSLVLSPVTPLIPDPFDRSGSAKYANCFSPMNNSNNNNHDKNNAVNADVMDTDAEEKAIKEKGFYLHPSPGSTPRETEPRLLPLFPVASPRVAGSANPSS